MRTLFFVKSEQRKEEDIFLIEIGTIMRYIKKGYGIINWIPINSTILLAKSKILKC